MIINVDVTNGASVDDAETLTAFNAISTTDDNDIVGAAMGEAGFAADDAGHVWVSADWIRSVVDADSDWSEAFDGMVGYAASKGWLNEAGTHIKAHIEIGC